MGREVVAEAKRRAIRRGVLRWFRKNRRVLPWRDDPTPYRVWVSEVMLQQTRTDTVLPYFERWMRRFPDVRALAKADLSDVLKVWEGLGYYSRAGNLHRAAKIVVAEHGGRIPRGFEAIRALPGIGRYTAGAILSIAFGQDVPVVDGNVARVISRLFAIEDDVTAKATQDRLWALAGALLPRGRAGEFNPALMEFGARVCTPRRPRCPSCPFQGHCLAFERGLVDVLPRKRRKAIATHDVAIGVIWRGDRVFVQRRPLEGFLGGLWEFPGGKRLRGESIRGCLARELREEIGFRGEIGPPVLTIRHAYSMYRVRLHAFVCAWRGGAPRPQAQEWRWARLDDLSALAFPAANRRLIEALRAGGVPGPPRSSRA